MDSLALATRESAGILNTETATRAQTIAGWLEEKKAKDVKVLDVTPFSSVADVMIIVTAQGARHAQSLADWLLEKYAENSITYLGMEGYAEGLWILVDSNDILVHILQEESRKFYNLDGLWSQCRSLLQDSGSSDSKAAASVHPSAGTFSDKP